MVSSSFSRLIPRSVWTPAADLTKRDDDLSLPGHHGDAWRARRANAPLKRTLVRYAGYALVGFLLFWFFRRMTYVPEKDIVRPYSQYRNGHVADSDIATLPPKPAVPTVKTIPPEAEGAGDAGKDDRLAAHSPEYNGVIGFGALQASLMRLKIPNLRDSSLSNVLFAASNLQSAAVLLPIACQRSSSQNDDKVLFALFGDSDIELEQLLKVNAIDESCHLSMIDARANQRHRLGSRLAFAATQAMYHLTSLIQPLAVIVDGSAGEDELFLDGIKKQIDSTKTTSLIELPDNAQPNFWWISQLDGAALAEWNNVHFDILIHAPPTGTGNIKRLLRSLATADLSGHTIPQITVELPARLQVPLEEFLQDFEWPSSERARARPNMLMLRHRVHHEKASASESVVRLLESFWPRDAYKNHALILSPHTEVSPQFFHYVKYALLQRLYSKAARTDDADRLMFGLSFTVPETKMHDAKPFAAPVLEAAAGEEGISSKQVTPFVWGAPSSDGMLVFGDKWTELHGFVSQVLEMKKTGTEVPMLLQSKDVAENQPAWMEYMVKLCRLRGYFTMYPSKETADAIIGVYNDLPYAPEGREKSEKDGRLGRQAGSSFDAGSQVGILHTLAKNGALTGVHDVPVLSWKGESSSVEEMVQEAQKEAAQFRRQIGKCRDAEKEWQRDRLARDLFCAVERDEEEE